MSSFRDIAINVIDSETLLGRSMYRVDNRKHDEIALQMAEWEKSNKVTVVPIGASAETHPCDKIAAQSKKVNARTKSAIEVIRTKRNIAGHQNLSIVAGGKIKVSVASVFVGVYGTTQEALSARDKYRARNDLPIADY